MIDIISKVIGISIVIGHCHGDRIVIAIGYCHGDRIVSW